MDGMTGLEAEKALVATAHRVLPGGTFGNVQSDLLIASGSGPRVTDVGGKEYIDYLLGSGPMFIGHAHPEVTAAVLAQGGPGVDRMEVQAGHALAGKGGVLALDAELEAADIAEGVVVAHRQVEIRQGRAEGGEPPDEVVPGGWPDPRPAGGGAVEADLQGLQQSGGPGRTAHLPAGQAALGLPRLQPVEEGVDPGFGDVGVELEIVANAEGGDGVAALPPAVPQEVVDGIGARGDQVRVHGPIPVRIHGVGDEGLVRGAHGRAGARRQSGQAAE
jgi:hypothetical protein